MNKNKIYILIIILLLFSNNAENIFSFTFTSKNKYLSIEWVKYIRENPGKYKDTDNLRQKRDYAKERSSKYFEKANSFYNVRDSKKIIENLEKAFEFYATSEMYYLYGISLYWQNMHQDAIDAYKISIFLEYEKPHLIYYNIACAYSQLKNANESFENLKKAVDFGYNAISQMIKDPGLEYIRQQPSWDEKIKSYKIIISSPNKKELYDGSGRGIGAGGIKKYTFCSNKIIFCNIPNMSEKYFCQYGIWRIDNNIIKIQYFKESGKRGVGKSLNIPVPDDVYSIYEKYEIKINKTEEFNWNDILYDINKSPDEQTYQRWKIIPKNDCNLQ